MEDSNTILNQERMKIEEEPDEIGWVMYGLLSTISIAIYQIILVQFINTPSTISVKMALSVVIGLIAIVFISIIELYSH